MSQDYAPAHWQPSPNFDTSRAGGIDMIIIHTTEGKGNSGLYEQAINWFAVPDSQVSAHYVLRSADGEVTQCVSESDIAWHCGNGEYNARSVGIEHEGYAMQPKQWFSDAMLTASAKLAADICFRYHIPADRLHIIGHYEVPNPKIDADHPAHFGGESGHTDPDFGWPWERYIGMVQTALATLAIKSSPIGIPVANWVPLIGENSWRSVAQDGWPYKPPVQETLDDGKVYTVQYFERAIFALAADGATVSRVRGGAELYGVRHP